MFSTDIYCNIWVTRKIEIHPMTEIRRKLPQSVEKNILVPPEYLYYHNILLQNSYLNDISFDILVCSSEFKPSKLDLVTCIMTLGIHVYFCCMKHCFRRAR